MTDLIIVGNHGVGKTFYLRRLLGLRLYWNYDRCPPVSSHQYQLQTTQGLYHFNLYELSEMEEHSPPCQGAIIFYDVTSTTSFENCQRWKNWLKRTYGDIPIILCGNKTDRIEQRMIPSNRADFEFSAWASPTDDLEQPFVYFLQLIYPQNELQVLPLPSAWD